jgi:hypothetical protein
MTTNAQRFASFRDRFYQKVKPDPADPVTGCHIWTGAKDSGGYGAFEVGGKQCRAHRVAWELVFGPIPADGKILHWKCDNPACVNPLHLRLGTQRTNTADRDRKGRRRGGASRGERNRSARLTNEQVLEIRADTGSKQKALAAKYGVSICQISNIRSRKYWKHLP